MVFDWVGTILIVTHSVSDADFHGHRPAVDHSGTLSQLLAAWGWLIKRVGEMGKNMLSFSQENKKRKKKCIAYET